MTSAGEFADPDDLGPACSVGIQARVHSRGTRTAPRSNTGAVHSLQLLEVMAMNAFCVDGLHVSVRARQSPCIDSDTKKPPDFLDTARIRNAYGKV